MLESPTRHFRWAQTRQTSRTKLHSGRRSPVCLLSAWPDRPEAMRQRFEASSSVSGSRLLRCDTSPPLSTLAGVWCGSAGRFFGQQKLSWWVICEQRNNNSSKQMTACWLLIHRQTAPALRRLSILLSTIAIADLCGTYSVTSRRCRREYRGSLL